MTENQPQQSSSSDADGLLAVAALGLMAAGAGKLAGSAGEWFSGKRQSSARKRAVGLLQQAMAVLNRGDLAGAAARTQLAIDADATYPDAHSALAWILARQRADLPRALAHANRALAFPATPIQRAGHYNCRAEVRAQMGDFDMAIADSRSCLEHLPDQRTWPGPAALQRLGIAQCMKHEYVTGYATLRQTLALGPDNQDLRIALAQVTRERHLYEESIGHWEAALRHVQAHPPPGADVAYMTSMLLNDLGATHFHAGNPQQAEALQRRATEVHAGNPYPWLNLAIAAGRRDDVAAMRGLMSRSLGAAQPQDQFLVTTILAHAVSDEHGNVMLDALHQHHRISGGQHRDCIAAWHKQRNAGNTNINITNSKVGAVGGPGSDISGVGMYGQ